MSLRRKIILLFGLFAIVPMLALAGFSYWQAGNLLKSVVKGQLETTVQSVVDQLEVVAAEAEAAMVGVDRGDGGSSPSEGLEASALPVSLHSLQARAAYVGWRDGKGNFRLLSGFVPEKMRRCSNGWNEGLVQFFSPSPGPQGGAVLEMGFWASELVDLGALDRRHSLWIVDRPGGAVLLGNGCESRPPVGLAADGPGREIPGGDWESVETAMGQVDSMDWEVLATASVSDVLGSLRHLAVLYWLFVLALGGSTAIAFSILIGRFTRSLTGLARAAEEIGLGELDPWLPVPTSGELGQLTTAFSRMLERIRHMMSQVSQSGRLAVVGQLSAYLAHEIRNPLSSIKLNLQRLLRWTRTGQLPEYCREPLEISLKEVERLNASVTGVLQLSKAQDGPKETVELHNLLSEAADLVAGRFRRQGVNLTLNLDAEADRVMARAGQLKSVALNLMVNALEAQPQGGFLNIRTTLGRSPDLDGPSVSLHFQDGGPGVPPEVRDRIFEPFFTTKPGGAGIGLAMAKQSVEDSGGHLYLASSYSRDAGAEFVMVFPLASLDARGKVGVLPPHELTQHSGQPLLMDGSEGESDTGQGGKGPEYLLTPGGLKAVLALSTDESEGMN